MISAHLHLFAHTMHLIPILLAALLFSFPAHAQLKNENLLVTVPEGYKVDFQDRNNDQQITEMVPAGQSVKDWTEMLTVQNVFGMTNVTPEQVEMPARKHDNLPL
jgi:hypothetical protein